MEQLNLITTATLPKKSKVKIITTIPVIEIEPVSKGFQLQYDHPHGKLYQGNSFDR